MPVIAMQYIASLVACAAAFLVYLIIHTKKPIGDSANLVIAVLSARENYEQRQAIRKTWMQSGLSNKSAIVKFFVGRLSCPFHPSDRTDEYSCQPWSVSPVAAARAVSALVPIKDSGQVMSTHEIPSVEPAAVPPLLSLESDSKCQFTFKVMHEVVLTALGVLPSSACGQMCDSKFTQVNIDLLDSGTEAVVASSSFNRHELSDAIDRGNSCRFLYKAITGPELILAKGFLGILSCENCSACAPVDMSCGRFVYDTSGLIQFRTSADQDDVSKTSSTAAVSFQVTASDPHRLLENVRNVKARHDAWTSHSAKMDAMLASEAESHGDLVFVETVDVYRHLPDKLLKALLWFHERVKFEFFMKTDDDCYVNVEGILGRLSVIPRLPKMWLGSFRHYWAVQGQGKWAEGHYSGLSYPDFACGAGYVLSRDAAAWLVLNQDHLWHFQGEDVSMGIWLAAIQPTYVQDSNFRCTKDCTQNALAMPDVSPAELMDMWKLKQTTGKPC